MKIKVSELEQLIKEEIKIFRENNGSFPSQGITGIADEGMKKDTTFLYTKLLETLGAERLLEDLIKNIDNKALSDALNSIAKLYGVRS